MRREALYAGHAARSLAYAITHLSENAQGRSGVSAEGMDALRVTKLNQIFGMLVFGMLAVTATLCGAETALARNYPHLPCR